MTTPYPSPGARVPSRRLEAPMARWLVRMHVDGSLWGDTWLHDAHVWAYSSCDAVERARSDFYGTWATPGDRTRLPLRVVEVSQVAV